MAKRLLRDIDPLAAAILDGDHDDILGVIIQALFAPARSPQGETEG